MHADARRSNPRDPTGRRARWRGWTAALVALTLAVLGAGPAAAQTPYPNPGHVTGDVAGVHDPEAVIRPDGTYVVASTGNGIDIRTSTDRVRFQRIGAAFPNGTPWASPYTNNGRHLWAPDLSYHNGQYYLYYSASTFGSQRSAIFLATSPNAMPGTWTHRGLVIDSSTAVDYNAIDPNLVVDDQGRWWLTFGSFWSGIKMIALDPATGLRAAGDRTVHALARRTANSGAVEAPFIHQRGGWYYLFVSFDFCCRGTSSTYRTMVGRSASPTGPYVDRNGVPLSNGGGTEILASHGAVRGPGHPSVLTDGGDDLLLYHYYASSGRGSSSYLGINLLGWDAQGWPFVY
ncbi:MAG TPA: arabinan endo-1,5-alpha-L-arabinosidase [Euzebyales bacterium]|nr:arabinan endo-1,5-alpha-L-arabinosidase [Euzebyales bacterium]